MTRRYQFSLRRLFRWTTCTALVLGVISWLGPETRFVLLIWAQVFACLFGGLFMGVYAIAAVLSCYKLCRRVVIRGK